MVQWEYCRLEQNTKQNEIAYIPYEKDSAEVKVIVEPDGTSYIKAWRTLIVKLGLSEWEVVNIYHSDQGAAWYFKRAIQEGNEYLTL